MLNSSLLILVSVALAGADAPRISTTPTDPILDQCEIVSIENQDVPGSEAGVLATLEAREGMQVTKGMELGQIDIREAEAQRQIKQFEFETAEEKAKSLVDVQYQQKASDVAKTAYLMMKQANLSSPKTVTKLDLLKAQLEWEKADLGIEKAKEENIVAKLTAQSKQAELKATEIAIERRTLRAPFDGIVLRIHKHVGEWVAPGNPVLQIVRVDRLRVHGEVDATKYGPADLEGRRVTVEVTLPRGRTLSVQGKVVFASPLVENGQLLPVMAEIECPMEDGRPLVRAGLEARMRIHVTEPAADARPAAAARKATPKS